MVSVFVVMMNAVKMSTVQIFKLVDQILLAFLNVQIFVRISHALQTLVVLLSIIVDNANVSLITLEILVVDKAAHQYLLMNVQLMKIVPILTRFASLIPLEYVVVLIHVLPFNVTQMQLVNQLIVVLNVFVLMAFVQLYDVIGIEIVLLEKFVHKNHVNLVVELITIALILNLV